MPRITSSMIARSYRWLSRRLSLGDTFWCHTLSYANTSSNYFGLSEMANTAIEVYDMVWIEIDAQQSDSRIAHV